MINFMFVLPNVFSERGYKITPMRQDVNLYHLKSGRMYFVTVCEIFYDSVFLIIDIKDTMKAYFCYRQTF